MNAPRIAIVGPGAIGCCIAAGLGDAGHEVTLCARTGFERLSRTLDGVKTDYDHPLVTRPDALEGPVDWLMLATKTYQTEGARDWLEQLVGPDTRVAVLQNGIRHADRVARYADAQRVVPCIMLLPAELDAPGASRHNPGGRVQVPASPAGEAFVRLFGEAPPFAVEAIDDFTTATWVKLALNSVGGAICALALKPLAAMGEPCIRPLAHALIDELVAVGEAEGARFPPGFPDHVIDVLRGVGHHWTSMALDRREGRPMEWQARNAVIGELGRRHGISTPMNDALTSVLELADMADVQGLAE